METRDFRVAFKNVLPPGAARFFEVVMRACAPKDFDEFTIKTVRLERYEDQHTFSCRPIGPDYCVDLADGRFIVFKIVPEIPFLCFTWESILLFNKMLKNISPDSTTLKTVYFIILHKNAPLLSEIVMNPIIRMDEVANAQRPEPPRTRKVFFNIAKDIVNSSLSNSPFFDELKEWINVFRNPIRTRTRSKFYEINTFVDFVMQHAVNFLTPDEVQHAVRLKKSMPIDEKYEFCNHAIEERLIRAMQIAGNDRIQALEIFMATTDKKGDDPRTKKQIKAYAKSFLLKLGGYGQFDELFY